MPSKHEIGRLGGKARAAKLSPEERSRVARKAAHRRWNPLPDIHLSIPAWVEALADSCAQDFLFNFFVARGLAVHRGAEAHPKAKRELNQADKIIREAGLLPARGVRLDWPKVRRDSARASRHAARAEALAERKK